MIGKIIAMGYPKPFSTDKVPNKRLKEVHRLEKELILLFEN